MTKDSRCDTVLCWPETDTSGKCIRKCSPVSTGSEQHTKATTEHYEVFTRMGKMKIANVTKYYGELEERQYTYIARGISVCSATLENQQSMLNFNLETLYCCATDFSVYIY